tara:strand:- start:584 stop:1474 length:891 start_codon:yes stop_codon:yes gene_type:complete
MEVAVIGLGKMGAQIAEKLSNNDFKVYCYDVDKNISFNLDSNIVITKSIKDLVSKFNGKKIIWLMLPSGQVTNNTIEELNNLLDRDDIIIDGGNSFYKDTKENFIKCKKKNIHFIDCGTSGGIWGLTNGFCLTIGGEKNIYEEIKELFVALSDKNSKGGLYVGQSGSGHYVKMIHNGIEYGMMQSIAEGLDILKNKSEFKFKLEDITENWRTGSVIQSWLLDLISSELKIDPKLNDYNSKVNDSGEGRWTIKESIDLSVPIPSIYSSISQRFNSRQNSSFAGKILSAMRNAFGGHK